VFLRKETNTELPGLLGRTDFPLNPDPHVSEYNAQLYWTAAAMQKGGYTFETFIHEFGHGLGLLVPPKLDDMAVNSLAICGKVNNVLRPLAAEYISSRAICR
jgi:hypothetical protein